MDQWNSRVYEPAVAIIEAILKGEKPEQKPVNETFTGPVENQIFHDSSNAEKYYCDVNFCIILSIFNR